MSNIYAPELDYHVDKLPLTTYDNRNTSEFGLFNGEAHLGTVKKNYTLIQNTEIIDIVEQALKLIETPIDFTRTKSLIANSGGTAVLQLQLPSDIIKASQFSRGNDDTIGRQLTIMNSFDGKSAIAFGTINTVMSCMNQFRYVYNNINTKFRHTKSLHQNIKNAAMIMTNIINTDLNLMKAFKLLNNTPVNDEVINNVLYDSLGVDRRFATEMEINGKELSTRAENKIFDMRNSMQRELTSKGSTLWGLFNGVTYYYNHVENKGILDSSAHKHTNAALNTIFHHAKLVV